MIRVAVEWTLTGLRGAAASYHRGKWEVLRTFSHPWANPSPSLAFDPNDYVADLTAIVQAEGLSGQTILLALPRSEAIVHWRSGEQFPWAPEKTLVGSCTTTSPEGEVSFFIGASKDRIAQYEKAFEKAGMILGGVQLALTVLAAGEGQEQGECIILDPAEPQVIFVQNKIPRFARTLPAWRGLSSGELNVLVNELRNTLDYAAREWGFKSPTRFVVLGEMSPALVSALSRVAAIPCETSLGDSLVRALAGSSITGPWILPPEKSPAAFRGRRIERVKIALAGSSILFVFLGLGLGHHQDTVNSAKDPTVQREVRIAKVVMAMFESMPAGSRLAELQYDATRKNLLVRGRSPDYGQASQFLGGLTKAGAFKAVRNEKTSLLPSSGDVEFSGEVILR